MTSVFKGVQPALPESSDKRWKVTVYGSRGGVVIYCATPGEFALVTTALEASDADYLVTELTERR